MLLFSSHCGYTLSHRLRETFRGKRVYVPVFTNRTNETGAEAVFTNALIRELESRALLVVSSRGSEALELLGTLSQIAFGVTAQAPDSIRGLQPYRRLPAEIGVTVRLRLVLRDPVTNVTLWSNQFEGFRRVNTPTDRTFDYQLPSHIGPLTQSILFAVYSDIARDIMRDVYDDMVDFF